jgi:hypothetical protein
LRAEFRHQHPFGVRTISTGKASVKLVRQRITEFRARRFPSRSIERLGVQKQSIHIEYYGANHAADVLVRLKGTM